MLGDRLRAEREKQNLTVKDIEKGTSIRALYIEHIEDGKYDELPGEVYTKGFIRNYAAYLKMDPEKILQQYREEVHPEQAAAPLAAEPEKAPKAETAFTRSTESASVFSSSEDFRGRVEKSRSTQKILIGVLAAAFVVGGAYLFFGSEDQPPEEASSSVKAETSAPAAPAPAPEEKKYDDVEVSANFTDNCWTKVVVDGQTAYEGTAKKDQKMSWKGKDKVIVTAGNAAAIEVTCNGKAVGKFGNAGEVIAKSFTKDKVEDVK